MSRTDWCENQPMLSLVMPPDRIEIGGESLVVSISEAPLVSESLTVGERAQFARLASATDSRKRSWLCARAALKQLMSRLGLGAETAHLNFPNPCFSLAHSGVYAVAVGSLETQVRGVGIDLEMSRPMRPGIERHFLSPAELGRLQGDENLLRLWTVKEACFKAELGNEGKVLSQFEVDDLGLLEGQAHCGQNLRFRYRSYDLGVGWLSVAVAN